MDGQTLQGIGSICGGIAALLAVALGVLRGPRLLDFLKDRMIIVGERDHAKSLAHLAQERADFAERTADGAERYARTIEERLTDLERRMVLFDRLVVYTRELLQWAMHAERVARTGGVALPPCPPIPADLVAALRAQEVP